MAVVVLLTMIGAAWPVLFWEGSPLAKNLERRVWVDAVDDKAVAAAMEAQLYGEEPPQEQISTRDPEPIISLVRQADRVSAILCIIIAASIPFLARWRSGTAWLYLLPTLWLLLNAWALASNGGKAHAELAIPAQATRWMLPLCLALLIARAEWAKHAANWLLRIACACTFAIHGWEAFELDPAFQDLIYVSGRLIGLDPTPAACHALLRCIGIMDGLLALSVILIHSPKALYWMTMWGLITAISRPLSIGLETWPEVAIRLANGAAPWLIACIGLPALLRFKKQNESLSGQATVSQDP